MTSIESLLHRRSDLSTFLVHFTRDYSGSDARANILSILEDRQLEARSAFGMGPKLPSQRAVCFSEAPLEHVWTLCEQIEGRQVSLSQYGLVFTKVWAREHGCNPVWYLDQTPSGHEWLTKAVNALTAAADGDREAPIFRLTPFIEQMGPRKEFWWEREWRHVGDLRVTHDGLVAILAPRSDHERMRQDLEAIGWSELGTNLLDPGWGLERMIAALAGVPESDAGPLPRKQ